MRLLFAFHVEVVMGSGYRSVGVDRVMKGFIKHGIVAGTLSNDRELVYDVIFFAHLLIVIDPDDTDGLVLLSGRANATKARVIVMPKDMEPPCSISGAAQ